MKPKEYLKELSGKIDEASSEHDKEVYSAMLFAANKMWHLMNDKDIARRKANADKLREYNREYMRQRRAKLKEENE